VLEAGRVLEGDPGPVCKNNVTGKCNIQWLLNLNTDGLNPSCSFAILKNRRASKEHAKPDVALRVYGRRDIHLLFTAHYKTYTKS
jgi:hypothetical protein